MFEQIKKYFSAPIEQQKVDSSSQEIDSLKNELDQIKTNLWAYDGAIPRLSDVGKNDLWMNAGTEDDNLLSSLPNLRLRSRGFYRNNLVAGAIINSCTNITVGAEGFTLSPNIPNEPKLNDIIERKWKQWTSECDAGGEYTFKDLTKIVVRNSFIDGDIFPNFVQKKDKNSRFLSKIRLMDALRISGAKQDINGKDTDDNVRAGILCNEYGDKLGVFIKNDNPKINKGKPIYKAFKNSAGIQQVCQVYSPIFVNTTRGKPLLSSVLNSCSDVDMFIKTELVTARFSSAINVVKETPFPSLDNKQYPTMKEAGFGIAGNKNGINVIGNPVISNPDQQRVMAYSPGQILQLKPGEKISQFGTKRPTDMFQPFVQTQLTLITASLGLSYPFVFRDISQLNGAGARFDIIQNQVVIKAWQENLTTRFLDPAKIWFLLELIERGDIWVPEGMDQNDLFDACTFIPPKFTILDVNKEVIGSKLLIDSALSTQEEECKKYSRLSYSEIIEQRGREIKEMQALGIPLDVAGKGETPDSSLTPTGEISKPPGSGPGKIPSQDSTRS